MKRYLTAVLAMMLLLTGCGSQATLTETETVEQPTKEEIFENLEEKAVDESTIPVLEPLEDLGDEENTDNTAKTETGTASTEIVKVPLTAEIKPEGTAGRLYIGDWSVALYVTDAYDGYAVQRVVDAQDSAVWATSDEGVTIIADHNSQGFERIKSLGVGDTFIIVRNGEQHTYRCESYYGNATRYSGDLARLPDGRDVWFEGDTYLFTQTCNNIAGSSITIQYWAEV